MRNQIRIISLLIFSWIISTGFQSTILAQSTDIITNYSLLNRVFDLTIYPTVKVFPLPNKNIEPESESVISKSDTLQRDLNYQVDYIKGIITFREVWADTTQLTISYTILQPFETISERLFDGPILLDEETDSTPITKSRTLSGGKRFSLFEEEKIRSRGSLVRGLKIGSSEGLSLNSGLRLQLNGEVAEGVMLVASMTDQNTPFQPSGNTQSLKEIDKISIGLSGSNFNMILGDIEVDYRETNFANYRRKLQGGKGSAKIGSSEISFAGAVSRGKFRTASFIGIEGNQGPYRLTGDDGSINVFVIAGSEKVYIDGERMVRGETNDYVIDYSNSELKFTPYRIITSDSRITVDYEFSDRSYNRSVIASSVSTILSDGKVKFGGRFIRESDDRNQPIGIDFNSNEINALSLSGDGNAFADGGVHVGAGMGAYNKVFNSDSGDSVFSFVGKEADGSFIGEWAVLFTQVGEGKGDYDNRIGDSLFVTADGNLFFDFVGAGNGSFIAKKLLKTPLSQSIFSFDMSLHPTKNLKIETEIGLSEQDRNTFSSIGDGDNSGSAFLVKSEYSSTENNKIGIIVDGYFRRIEKDFSRIGRIDEIEFDRKWNIPGGFSGTETIMETGAKLLSKNGVEVYGKIGNLEIKNRWNSNRIELGSKGDFSTFGNYYLNQESLSSNSIGDSSKSDWIRRKGRLEKRISSFSPYAGFEFEDKKDSDSLMTGFKFTESFVGIKAEKIGALNAFIEYRERNDESFLDNILQPRSNAISKTLGFEIPSNKTFSSSVRFSRRTRSFKGEFKSIQSASKSNLIAIRTNLHPFNGAFRLTTDYRAANELISGQERVYLRVEEGRGNFRFDEDVNEYVPDETGDFVLRTRQTDIYEPVTDLRLSIRMIISPKRMKSRRGRKSKRGFWQQFSSRTFIRIDEKSRETDTASLFLFKNSFFRNSVTTIRGNLTFEEDLTLLEKRDGSSLRLRYRYFEEMNNQFVSGGEEQLTRETSFRWKKTISPSTRYEFEGNHQSTLKNFTSFARRSRKINSNELSLNLSHLPSSKIEFGSKIKYGWDTDSKQSSDLKATLREIELRNNYFLKKRGMVRLLFGWAHVNVSPNGTPITFEMANGFKEGDNFRWSIGVDYRIGSNLNAMLTYEGKNESFRDTRHIGRAEVRAWF